VTKVKLTPAELALLDRQERQGIPYPTDILAWRKAHAAALASIEADLQADLTP
jgi:hypothetical protein